MTYKVDTTEIKWLCFLIEKLKGSRQRSDHKKSLPLKQHLYLVVVFVGLNSNLVVLVAIITFEKINGDDVRKPQFIT